MLPKGGSRPELCPLIRKDLSTYLRTIAVVYGVVCNALFSVGVGTMLRLAPLHGLSVMAGLVGHARRPAAPAFPALLAPDRQSLAASPSRTTSMAGHRAIG